MSIVLDSSTDGYDHRSLLALPTFVNNPEAEENEDQHRHNISQAASISRAQRYRNINCPRQAGFKLFPIWATEINELKKYGLGVMLYFKLLKRLGLLFFFLFLCSMPSLIFNLSGSGISHTNVLLAYTTLGNQGDQFLSNSTANVYDSSIMGIERRTIGLIMSLSDLFYSMVFIIFLYWLEYQHKREAQLYSYEMSTVSQYAVAVHNLPKNSLDRTYLRKFFSRYGAVVDVSIAYNNYPLIKLYQKRGELRKALIAAELLNQKKSKVKKLTKKIKELDGEITVWQGINVVEPRVAYIIFDRIESGEACLKDYPHSFWHNLFMSKAKKLYSTHKPFLEHAAEPSNIVYEHLQYSYKNKQMRRSFTFITTLALIIISAVIVYIAAYFQNRIPQAGDCSSAEANAQYCYCKSLSSTQLLSEQSQCSDYIAAEALRSGLVFITATSTVFVNGLILILTRKIAQLERHSSRTSQQRGIANKLSIGLFINTGLILLLVNANLTPFVGTNLGLRYLLSGAFSDFVSDWYVVVGNSILITMCINIFTPIIWSFLACFYDQCKRKKCTSVNAKTSQEYLNKRFAGRKFELDERYAVIVTNIYVIMMYSSGLPLLLFIGSLIFFFSYWMDKYSFLRNYRIPPKYDNALDTMAIKRIKPAALLHCIMAFWFYSSPCTDSYPVTNQNISQVINNFKVPILSIQSRLLQWNSLPLALLAFILIFYYCFKGLFTFLLCSSNNSLQIDENNEESNNQKKAVATPASAATQRKSYFEACAGIRFESYKLHKQAEFKSAYLITKSLLQMAPEEEFSDVRSKFEREKQAIAIIDNELNCMQTPIDKRKLSLDYNAAAAPIGEEKKKRSNQIVPVGNDYLVAVNDEEDSEEDNKAGPKAASTTISNSLKPKVQHNLWIGNQANLSKDDSLLSSLKIGHAREKSEFVRAATSSPAHATRARIPYVCDKCNNQFLVVDHGVQAKYSCPYCKEQFIL
jgi:hypothetical protein